MKSYEQALSEIYSKIDEQRSQINKRKKRTQKILLTVAVLCLVMTVTLSVGNVLNTSRSSGGDSTDGFAGYSSSTDDALGSSDVNNAELSIYPSAWKRMNAVIVKWGEQNDKKWSESYDQNAQHEDQSYTTEYVGINVEFVKVYSDTMSDSLDPNIEETISQTAYLMIPKYCLSEIKAGDMALIFLEVIGNTVNQDSDGTSTVTHLLGVRHGDFIAPEKYVPASIFAVSNSKVSVKDDAYEIDPQNGEYYMGVMNLLYAANEYVLKYDSGETAVFKNGMDVEELADFFAYVCSSSNYWSKP